MSDVHGGGREGEGHPTVGQVDVRLGEGVAQDGVHRVVSHLQLDAAATRCAMPVRS
ncbi:hypothetical protein HD597_000441 [Nonomuraea thailandensis]|uniref:Uncharacterized protein n=1 Tax=Nonomuraea thailandensis TaxID=1188745 RepID=A0A9X2G6X9_9ACTN|nr:hypothetical protein [Nonomuraea thailandensis]MCP2353421.1 hypothetical protein [Nonomuraea thailandensis]